MEGIKEKQNKIWICNRCKSVFGTRWMVSRHYRLVHKLQSKDASNEAMLSEWWRVYNPDLLTIQKKK